jgi:hypothetical protein
MSELMRQKNEEQRQRIWQAVQQQPGPVEQVSKCHEILDEIEARQIALEVELHARTERRGAEQSQQKENERDQDRPYLTWA